MMDYNKLKIFEGKSWNVFLHENQTVPGRTYLWYKGKDKDLLEISTLEWKELFELSKKIKLAINKSFSPNMFNYLSLNNATKHLHFHIIPRYSKEIIFSGVIFLDENFGGGYKRNHSFILSEEILIKIKNKIKLNLK